MIYRYTIDNILTLMQNMGTLKREQIKRFFSSELEPNRVEYLLNQLAIKHILIYDEDADTFSFVGAAPYSKDASERLMRAFWVLVAAGSSNVQEIMLTRYPTQLLFISPENDAYDVTVVNTSHEAILAQRVRSETIMRGVSDIVTHVAVLQKKSDVTLLQNCGFDCYCTIDPLTQDVKYYQISGN